MRQHHMRQHHMRQHHMRQNIMTRSGRGIVFAGLLLLAAGCGGEGGSLLISEQQEIEIGAEVHAGIIADYPIYSNTTVTQYVTSVGEELVAKSKRPNLDHKFYVLETEVINAFAAPGGYVYVTTGLMRNMSSRAELAGVLGHEVGHVSAYHGVEELEAQFTVGLLLDMVFGDESAAGQVVGYATDFYWKTAHSQDQELESDRLGVEFSYAAGYNPWGLVDFFEFLGQASGESDDLSGFLSSHPSSSERIAQSTEQINTLGVDKMQAGLVYDNASGSYPAYDAIKAMLPAPSDTTN